MSESYFIDVISGRKRGSLPTVLRGALQAVEPIYFAISQFRNTLFQHGIKSSRSAGVPVIAVGNITTGGTGKTPTVAWLVNWLQASGFRPGIVSRGYRSLDGQANDEKLLLDQLCRDVPHFQNRDRYQASQSLLAEHDCNVLILDDGFQHRRLNRNFDLVLIDALNPFGYDHLLPRGLLRESLQNLKRSKAVLLTRADHVSTERLQEIQTTIAKHASSPVLISQFQPTCLVNSVGENVSFNAMNGKRMCAFAGIGNPGGFRRTLAATGLAVDDRHFKAFPDHHHYRADDLLELGKWAKQRNAECLVTTRKDLVKIDQQDAEGFPLWAVDIQLRFDSPSEPLERQILQSINNRNTAS